MLLAAAEATSTEVDIQWVYRLHRAARAVRQNNGDPIESDWQPLRMWVEGIWLAMKPGCPIAHCDWGTTVTSINTPDGRVDPATDALALLMGTVEHLREEHQAAYPWEDHAGQDEHVTIQLEPLRLDRLIEVLRSAGAHPSGLGSYEAANDANTLADDLAKQVQL